MDACDYTLSLHICCSLPAQDQRAGRHVQSLLLNTLERLAAAGLDRSWRAPLQVHIFLLSSVQSVKRPRVWIGLHISV